MSRPVTMDDVAAKAGVSRGAVSLALRGSSKISPKTSDRIREVAGELGYSPNLNASRLAQTDFLTLGLLASDLHNPIIPEILDGFVLTEEKSKYETQMASGFNSIEYERSGVEYFLSQRVKGVVLIGSLMSPAEIHRIAAIVPTVLVGRQIDGVDCVFVDSEKGGRLAADHLIDLGHSSFAHLSGGKGAGAKRRSTAFAERIKERRSIDPVIVEGDYNQESGYRAATEIFAMKERPSAIFAANDFMALGVLGAARERGLEAGSDFALVGFDDISLAGYDYISLSTIAYQHKDMGRLARELIIRRCEDPSSATKMIALEPTLIVRKSSSEVFFKRN